MILEIELSEEQIGKIAVAVAALQNQRPAPAASRGFYTVREAAAVMQVSEDTIYRMVEAGRLPRVPGMRSIRIPRSAIAGNGEG